MAITASMRHNRRNMIPLWSWIVDTHESRLAVTRYFNPNQPIGTIKLILYFVVDYIRNQTPRWKPSGMAFSGTLIMNALLLVQWSHQYRQGMC